MRLKLLAIVLLLVVGGGAVFVGLGGLPRGAAASTTFLTATASVTDVSDDVAATGSIASATGWDLAFGAAPTVAGSTADSSSSATGGGATGTWNVTKVSVAVGDTVKADQVLATATNADLSRSIAAAKNDWTAAKLNEEQAESSYDDAVDNDRGDDAIRQARSGWLNAKNQLATAHQNLVDLKAAAARNRVVAPAAGIVTAVNATAGLEAPSGAAITVAAADYQVTADVVESDISSLKLQQPASVTVSAIGATLDGTVTAIAPTATSGSGSNSVVSYAVTVSLKNPPVTMRSGMTADVTITTASATGVLAVPAAALRGTNGNYTVLVMTANGIPEARPVTVGLITSSLVEIQSGLNPGDVVVTGTSATQRSTSEAGFGGAGGGGTFVVPGGGGGAGGRFNGGGNN